MNYVALRLGNLARVAALNLRRELLGVDEQMPAVEAVSTAHAGAPRLSLVMAALGKVEDVAELFDAIADAYMRVALEEEKTG